MCLIKDLELFLLLARHEPGFVQELVYSWNIHYFYFRLKMVCTILDFTLNEGKYFTDTSYWHHKKGCIQGAKEFLHFYLTINLGKAEVKNLLKNP